MRNKYWGKGNNELYMLQKDTFLLYVNIPILCFLRMFKKEFSDIFVTFTNTISVNIPNFHWLMLLNEKI